MSIVYEHFVKEYQALYRWAHAPNCEGCVESSSFVIPFSFVEQLPGGN
jgi:hypothetical protein